MATSLQSCSCLSSGVASPAMATPAHSIPSSLSPTSPLSLSLSRSARCVSRRRHMAPPATFTAPRASDRKDHGPSGDEWRPPSDWDKAWNSYKSMPPPSSMGLNKGIKGGKAGSRSSSTAMSSSGNSNPNPGGVPPPTPSQGHRRGPFKHMEQYVTRSPLKSDYPLSEEVDPLRRNERLALGAWTSESFTYAGFGVVALLFVFMAVVVGPPPS